MLGLKEQRIFTQNAFLVHAQTILGSERNFCAVSLFEFVSKGPVSLRG